MKEKMNHFLLSFRENKRLRILVIAGVSVLILALTVTMTFIAKNKQDVKRQQQLIENEKQQETGINLAQDTQGAEQKSESETELDTQSEAVQATEATESQTVQETQKATQQTEAQTETEPAYELIGTSSKGYTIERINGITYVDGILIANKTYSLPSTYAPGDISSEVKSAFYVMQRDAAAEGLNIYISSGYRSYSRQKAIYNNYVNKDGKAMADTYSARAGYSEHQSGLCFDLNSIDDSFALTAEGAWVKEHAHEYGFIIRYPQGKESITGYQYESWHLRYLGTELATDVYQSGLCLEEYLGITSAY